MKKNKKETTETLNDELKAEVETPATETQDKIAELEAKIQEQADRIAELEDIKLRQMAEFDNFRRRTNQEKLDLLESAGEKIFKEMLPLIDDFERAEHGLQNLNADNLQGFKEGVDLIYRKFLTFLQKQNVTAIETEGQDFSTDLHDAITLFDAGEEKKGKIIDCTEKGYKLGEKVIRYAKVVVGK